MQGAIIGFGTIAAGHLVGYRSTLELSTVAVVDPSPQRRAKAAAAGFRTYARFDDLLEHETLDFVDICAPAFAHPDYIRRGLDAGLHVLCEKPVFMPELSGYETVVEQIATSGRVMYPCHNYKFAPILRYMESVIDSPGFGDVLHARFRTLRAGHARGVPEWNADWRRDPVYSGGGILRDHGPHSIYLAAHLTDMAPESVSCISGSLQRGRFDATEDTALLTLRCAEGVQIVLDLSWSAAFRDTYYSVVGSRGSIVVENDHVQYTRDGQISREILPSDFDDPSHSEWFAKMFADFAETVADPQHQWRLIREAIITSVVIDAAYESAARRGEWVDVKIPRTSLI